MEKWIETLPKIELHLHIEGAIPIATFRELVKKYSPRGRAPSVEELEKRFVFRDFAHFIETWMWHCEYINEYDDFTLIAEGVAGYLAEQNVLYAEAFFSAPDFHGKRLSTQRIAEAIRKGLDRKTGAEVRLVGDVVRHLGPEKALRTVSELLEVKEFGVVGIGLGGMEKGFPPRLFKDVFEKARKAGFHTTAHAGEADGEESVRGAVNELLAERIGHGTHITDPRLLDLIGERRIGIEMCPLSNVRTKSVAAYREHPIRRFFDRGLLVSVNTDDPAMFGNPFCREIEALVDEFGFTEEEVVRLMENAAESSWMPREKKDGFKSLLRAGRRSGSVNAASEKTIDAL